MQVDQATFGYGRREVVHIHHLRLDSGRCLGIFGPNGVGKTTLARALAGLLAPLAGTVNRKPRLRCAYLPQQRSLNLNWPMTGFDAAAMALSAAKPWGRLGSAAANVRQSMAALNVLDLANTRFASLSGGQQQRLMLAGTLATDPQVLILDEPTDGLDVASRAGLLEVLRELRTSGLCVIMISHEVEDLLQIADEVAWLHWPDAPGTRSQVELIAPREMAARMTAALAR